MPDVQLSTNVERHSPTGNLVLLYSHVSALHGKANSRSNNA